jgi:hypothetical protein
LLSHALLHALLDALTRSRRPRTQLVFDAAPLSWTFFYETVLDADGLEAALSRALVAYPLLAGRLVTLPVDAHGRRRVAVACGNEGALMTRLHLPSVELPSRRGAQSGELPAWGQGWAGPPSLAQLRDDPSAPLLEVVRVNFARGCSLCIKSSHGLTDGQSLALFLACWSRCYADPEAPLPWPLMERAAQDMQSSVAEDEGAAPACTCVGAPRAAASPSGAIEDRLPAATLARLGCRAVVDPSMGFHLHSRAVVGACFHFTAAQLARIKCAAAACDVAPPAEAAAVDDGTLGVAVNAPSTFDALTALLWRSLALARKHRGMMDRGGLDATPPRLFFPANVRSRLQPPLPSHFVGNATMGIVVQLDAKTCAPAICVPHAMRSRVPLQDARGWTRCSRR